MKSVLSWLARTSLLYVLLVLAIGLAIVFGPLAPNIADTWRDETMGMAEIRQEIGDARKDAQARLERGVAEARDLPAERIERRIVEREADRERLEQRIEDQGDGLLSAYRPSRIVARKRAEIELALLERELAVLEAAREPRAILHEAGDFLAENPTVPTRRAIAVARQRCASDRRALAAFDSRYRIERQVRELVRYERTQLRNAARRSCNRVEDLREQRERGLTAARQAREARETLAALGAAPIPEDYAEDIPDTVLRDILLQAFLALLAIILLPLVWRIVAYFVFAPLAQRSRPIRIHAGAAGGFAPADTSRVSVEIVLKQSEEALVRQGFLQSSSLRGSKRTRWLLDWSRPFMSLSSGLRFLTAIRGADERVSVSAVSDPLAELAVLNIPADAAVVVRPSALAALVEPSGTPLRITSHWRLFSLPAWLTLQLRFLAFHGPIRAVLKGGRGVRIEPAESGRMVGQKQLIGFATTSGYSVIRSETFWPYFFGREPLLKDRIEGGDGIVLVEEAPLAGKSGLSRGLKGGLDALLKVFGV